MESKITSSWRYDVFLSFRGEDTRYNFTDHLYHNLVQKGIKTFIDDNELPRGEEISPALFKAIEESRLSIVVFSENFASSTWCLDELVRILQCKEYSKQQEVWPIFYKVDPSEVRNQRGSFGQALVNHEGNFKGNTDKVQKWRRALTKAANLSGWHFSDGYESKFIHNVVETISVQIANRAFLDVAKYPIGMESRVREMDKLLGVGENDVRMVGIWGIGGIGKSTIAKAVYNSIAHKFQGCCFLANVRDISTRKGLVKLQKSLLLNILGGKKLEVANADKGVTLIQERLGCKKVLVILDDVNKLDQLNKLAGGFDWFGSGSRVIITTRDRDLLIAHQVNLIYNVSELDCDEAFQLLSFHALKGNRHMEDEDCVKLANTIVDYAKGLPLVLTVFGSLLCGRNVDQWRSIIDNYKKVPNQEIQEVLKLSYDALEDQVKGVFLDIACLFNGHSKSYVIEILEGCDLNPKYSIQVLIEKALISIDTKDRIQMHDLLEEMGKEIVRRESPTEPGNRSRLWFYKDIDHVLTKNRGTNKIKGIKLQIPEGSESNQICLNAKSFSKMKNLQILFVNSNVLLSGEIDYLPNELRLLHWHEYPSQVLPNNFNPKKLVYLSMPRSCMLQLGVLEFKRFQNLKCLKLNRCKFLTEAHNFSGTPNLQHLTLDYCTGLVELHPSIGFLGKLVFLSLKRCSSLTMFPRIVNLKSLQQWSLEGCISLEDFPEIVGKMECLTKLSVSGTGIKELPSSSIGYFINLEMLNLARCENLTKLPYSIYALRHLKYFYVDKCFKLFRLPKMVRSKVSRSAEPLPLVFPTYSKISQEASSSLFLADQFQFVPNISATESDYEGNLLEKESAHGGSLVFPKLFTFSLAGCNLFGISGFLATLDCGSTLRELNLSGSDFVSLPKCMSSFVKLERLTIFGCKRIQEIPELPQTIQKVSVRDCVSLKRFAKLSNIMNRKESQMTLFLNMANCQRLFDNLVRSAKKKFMLLNEVELSSLFLSSQRSAFQVVFPGSDVPNWFSCRKVLKDLRECEFSITIPHTFRWEGKGLALCVTLEKSDSCCHLNYHITDEFTVDVYIRECIEDGYKESSNVFLWYVPFGELVLGERSIGVKLPYWPKIRIHFARISKAMKSCGVHLVMPPNSGLLC